MSAVPPVDNLLISLCMFEQDHRAQHRVKALDRA